MDAASPMRFISGRLTRDRSRGKTRRCAYGVSVKFGNTAIKNPTIFKTRPRDDSRKLRPAIITRAPVESDCVFGIVARLYIVLYDFRRE